MSDLIRKDMNNPEILAQKLNKWFAEFEELKDDMASKDQFARLALELKETAEKISPVSEELSTIKKSYEDLSGAIKTQGERLEQMVKLSTTRTEKKSFREVVKEHLKEGAFTAIADRKQSNAVIEIENTKALSFLGTDQAGSAVQAYKPFDIPVYPYTEPMDVRLVFPTGISSSAKLEYPQEKAYTDNMATLAENDASNETAITFEMVEVSAKRISTHIKVSRWALRNIDWLADHISTRLLQHFIKVLNTQSLVGNGLTVNMLGVFTGAPTIDFTGTVWENSIPSGLANYIDVLIQARGYLYNGYNVLANAAFVNPSDWSIMTSTKTTTADWVSQPPIITLSADGYTMVNNMMLLPFKDIPAGEYMVGAVDPANLQLLFNGPVEILATDSDSDDFQKNLVTIKLEAAVLLPLYHAGAFNKGVFATDKTALEAAP